MQSAPRICFKSADRLGEAVTRRASSIFITMPPRPSSTLRWTSRLPGCDLKISFIRSTIGGVTRAESIAISTGPVGAALTSGTLISRAVIRRFSSRRSRRPRITTTLSSTKLRAWLVYVFAKIGRRPTPQDLRWLRSPRIFLAWRPCAEQM